MTNNDLFVSVYTTTQRVQLKLAEMIADGSDSLKRTDISQVRAELTVAIAAITELERRAAGCPEPQRG